MTCERAEKRTSRKARAYPSLIFVGTDFLARTLSEHTRRTARKIPNGSTISPALAHSDKWSVAHFGSV